MVVCKSRRIPLTKVCAGDLTDPIQIVRRDLTPPALGQGKPSETFSVISSPWAGVETVRGTRRFFGINIEKSATHLFIIRYNPELPLLDSDNYFVNFKARYFRIVRVTNNDEEDWFMILQCAERGEDNKEASEA